MGRWHKPVKGSRAYWPRKRADRIYPELSSPPGKAPGPLAFAGYKAGMTQVLFIDSKKGTATTGKEVVRAVTVLAAPPLVVQGIRCYRRGPAGLTECGTVFSEKVAKDLRRKLTLPEKPAPPRIEELAKKAGSFAAVRLIVHTQPREALGKKTPELFELPLGGTPQEQWAFAAGKLGQVLRPEDALKPGEYVDAKAVSKGKGYQGPVKRFGIKIKNRKNKEKRRHVGTLGPKNFPDRVQPNTVAFAGQMGFQTRTEYNKRVLAIGKGDITPRGGFVNFGTVTGDYVLVEGSVPGPKKRLVFLRKGVRAPAPLPVEIKHLSRESQQ